MTDDVLAVADRTWRRLKVPRDVRAELAAELAADLAAAAADGRSGLDYVGGDPAGLARLWAAERGVVRPRHHVAGVTAAAVLAMVPGAAFGLLLVLAPSSMFLNDLLLRGRGEYMASGSRDGGVSFTYAVEPPGWLVPIWYVLAALFAYGGALAAVSAVLQSVGDVARRPTVRALARTLPGAAVLAAAAGVLTAGSQGYGTTGRTLATTSLIVLVVVAAAVLLTRLVVVRRWLTAAQATTSTSNPSASAR